MVVYSLPFSNTTTTATTTEAAATANSKMQYWSTVEKETNLSMKILFNQSDDIMDVAWSADSRRFTLCSLDHTMTVWEAYNHGSGEWRNVHRSAKDHTHYIQGVAYDPQGVYLASMGSDRMVKVYSRKIVKDSVINEGLAKYTVDKTSSITCEAAGYDAAPEMDLATESENKISILQGKVLPEILTNSTFSLQNKMKTMKFLNDKPVESTSNSTLNFEPTVVDPNSKDSSSTNTSAKRHHMFADELTLCSFFRRLSFTTDGAFLIVPAALWHGRKDVIPLSSNDDLPQPGSPTSVASNGVDTLAESSFATYLFARHHFDQPYKVLTGLEKVRTGYTGILNMSK